MTLPHLVRIRWAVRLVLLLGVTASVAANILHAINNPISQAIAGWPPVALLLTVELISRVPVHRRALAAVRLVATAGIAGIAAWVSYWHMVAVVGRYGETGATPFLVPCSVDGLVVVASVSLVELAGRIREAQDTATGNRTGDAGYRYPAGAGLVDGTGVLPGGAPAAALHQAAGDAGEAQATRGVPVRRRSSGARTGRARNDEQLLAALDEVPREPDGTVPVRRAARALGAGPDRARRLLRESGLYRESDDGPTHQPTERPALAT